MQRLCLISVVVATACSSTPGTGTVVYSEATTGHLRTLDVASGADRVIDDGGAFGSLSIAADGQRVAYVGSDAIVRVADLDGHLTSLELPNGMTQYTGCAPGPTWGPNNSLTYCIYDNGWSSFGLLPAPGQTARKLIASSVAVSNDASSIVYHRRDAANPTALGDVVFEHVDGSGQRVLAADVVERNITFTPDGQHVAATADNGVDSDVVVHALSDGATRVLGTGWLASPIAGGSVFSPDGSEMLAVLGGELTAVHLTTGVARRLTTFEPGVTITFASFIDADRVIFQRHKQTPPTGHTVDITESVRITDGTTELIVMPDNNRCSVRAIAIDAELAAVECEGAKIVSFDGTVHASRDAAALGISADRRGIVTLADDGALGFLSIDGDYRALAAASTRGSVIGPLAAYAP